MACCPNPHDRAEEKPVRAIIHEVYCEPHPHCRRIRVPYAPCPASSARREALRQTILLVPHCGLGPLGLLATSPPRRQRLSVPLSAVLHYCGVASRTPGATGLVATELLRACRRLRPDYLKLLRKAVVMPLLGATDHQPIITFGKHARFPHAVSLIIGAASASKSFGAGDVGVGRLAARRRRQGGDRCHPRLFAWSLSGAWPPASAGDDRRAVSRIFASRAGF